MVITILLPESVELHIYFSTVIMSIENHSLVFTPNIKCWYKLYSHGEHFRLEQQERRGGGVWDCMEITILLEFAMEGRQLSILNEKYILCIPTDNIWHWNLPGHVNQTETLPGEMLRGKIWGEQINSENRVQERERERRKVGDRENPNYSADSHNTRTWPSQLTANSGEEISLFHREPSQH